MTDDSRLTRRNVLKTSSAIAALGLAGCAEDGSSGDGGDGSDGGDGGGSDGGGQTTPSDDGPVKIGVVAPMEGAYAFMGGHMERSVKMLETELNDDGGVLGRDVEFVVRNGKGTPEGSTAAARQLVEQDGVHHLGGNSSTSAALAVSNYAVNQDLFYNVFVSTSRTLTSGSDCNKHTFKNSPHTHMVGSFGGEWMTNNVGSKAYILYPDYVYGEAVRDAWSTAITDAGGTIVGESAAELGTSDFGGIIDRVRASDADVIVQGFAGSGGIAFYKQAEVAGLTDRPMFAPAMLAPVGAAVPQGVIDAIDVYGMLFYDRNYEVPANQDFVNRYVDQYDRAPEFAAAWAYMGSKMMIEAIDRAGSTDTDDMIAEYEQLEYDTLVGPVQQRACDHQAAGMFKIGQLTGAEEVGTKSMPTYEYVASTNGVEHRESCDQVDCQM